MSNQFDEIVAEAIDPSPKSEVKFIVFEGNNQFIIVTPDTLNSAREFFEEYDRDIEDYDITPVYSPAVHIELGRPSASVSGL